MITAYDKVIDQIRHGGEDLAAVGVDVEHEAVGARLARPFDPPFDRGREATVDRPRDRDHEDPLERPEGFLAPRCVLARIVRRRGTAVWYDGNPDVLGYAFPMGASPRGPGHTAPAWLR